jgi:hypothetical protein
MRNHKFSAAVVGAALAFSVIPSMAAAGPSGTWTYIDTTPDPTTLQNPATHHCHGTLPSNPIDVNSQTFKATKKKGTLTLVSHNAADWAMEVRDKKGNVVAGTDGADVNTPENMTVLLKRGTYEVVYCNFAGEPTITVDYSYK